MQYISLRNLGTEVRIEYFDPEENDHDSEENDHDSEENKQDSEENEQDSEENDSEESDSDSEESEQDPEENYSEENDRDSEENKQDPEEKDRDSSDYEVFVDREFHCHKIFPPGGNKSKGDDYLFISYSRFTSKEVDHFSLVERVMGEGENEGYIFEFLIAYTENGEDLDDGDTILGVRNAESGELLDAMTEDICRGMKMFSYRGSIYLTVLYTTYILFYRKGKIEILIDCPGKFPNWGGMMAVDTLSSPHTIVACLEDEWLYRLVDADALPISQKTGKEKEVLFKKKVSEASEDLSWDNAWMVYTFCDSQSRFWIFVDESLFIFACDFELIYSGIFPTEEPIDFFNFFKKKILNGKTRLHLEKSRK